MNRLSKLAAMTLLAAVGLVLGLSACAAGPKSSIETQRSNTPSNAVDCALPQSKSEAILPAVSSDVIYPVGPSASKSSLQRGKITTRETRTRTTPDDTGKWTIRIEEESAGALQLRTRLTLSRDAEGVLLHELFNASRNSTATFSPPLRLVPASFPIIAPSAGPKDYRDSASSSSVRIVEGELPRTSTRTGKATAQARAEQDLAGNVKLITNLRITTGPAIIDRDAWFDLVLQDGSWQIAKEKREFAVRVGPLTIESDELTALPLPE
jgi:hypothetical protein